MSHTIESRALDDFLLVELCELADWSDRLDPDKDQPNLAPCVKAWAKAADTTPLHVMVAISRLEREGTIVVVWIKGAMYITPLRRGLDRAEAFSACAELAEVDA